MTSFAVLLAPFALLLPFIAADGPVAEEELRAAPPDEGIARGLSDLSALSFPVLEEPLRTPERRQVRIQQRIIIRIAPSPRRQAIRRIEERPGGDCVAVDAIAGVRPGDDNRLVLFMRDSRVLSAELDRACRAHDFYSGFYLERPGDGRLCVARDYLQSRAGANCRVAEFHRLVAVED